jgi:hypothetical protein
VTDAPVIFDHLLKDVRHKEEQIRGQSIPLSEPVLQVIQGPGHPLTITADLDVDSRTPIEVHHNSGKPLAASTFIKQGQATESKALAKSSFSSMVGWPRR